METTVRKREDGKIIVSKKEWVGKWGITGKEMTFTQDEAIQLIDDLSRLIYT